MRRTRLVQLFATAVLGAALVAPPADAVAVLCGSPVVSSYDTGQVVCWGPSTNAANWDVSYTVNWHPTKAHPGGGIRTCTMSLHLKDGNDDHLITYAVLDCLAEARARSTSTRTATLGPYTGLTYGLGQYHLVFNDGTSYWSCGASGPCPTSPHV